ncbi:MAG: hypothetical protein K6E34_13695 [Lachnospiraceae bacterium]|nr:hypothetical protein [Lachnospiraceae bacterium]
MEEVKKAVSAIEVALSRTKQADAPFTPADVEDMLIMYSRAILACNTYLAVKHPGYSNGKKRYDQAWRCI